jgi:rifampin ADP-ribosylating transferase
VAVTDDSSPELFYHGTRADLKPGDLIEPGYRPNFGNVERKTTWVYLTGTLEAAIWGAELALGEGPGRIYIVEPTGPMVDDPDLTDKRFPGNPTKSYCSRGSLRVTGEVTDWQEHSPEALRAMKDAVAQVARTQASLAGRIPSKADFDQIRDLSDGSAREWASDAQYLGCTLLMLIRGADAEISSALEYHSRSRGETHTIQSPRSTDVESRSQETDVALSGRVTDVTAWREGWAAALESCATEIGLGSEARVFIAVDADHDKLTFDVNAEGPGRSWHRNLRLVCGVLSDRERGEIWYFEPAPS